MAAILNWQPAYDLANADEIEVHRETDEVFVLWRGKGALYYLTAEGQLEVQDLQPGLLVNVPAGVWHGCLGNREVSWIIVENRDTHLHDTTVRKMTERELQTLRQKAPAWCRD
jgi:mannose-6-phosphate isomerase-like protein (cupin superfamily)